KETTISLTANANGHPVEISGSLGNVDKFLNKSSEPVALKADIDGNILNIAGEWGPLFPKQTMQVGFDLTIPGTVSLAEAVGFELDEFEDIVITGKLVGDGNTLALDPFEINLDDPSAELRVKGSIADLTSMEGISINTDANTASLSTLLQQLKIELPVPLPPVVEVSAQVGGGLKELALSELVIVAKDEGMDIKATASIGDLLHAKKITGKLTGTIDSLSRLSKYAKLDLPSLGTMQISGDLASNDKALQLNNLDIKLDSENLNFGVTGKVEDLLTVSGIDALVKADIRSFSEQNITELTALFKQLGTELPVEMLPQSISLSSGIQGSLEQLSLVDIQGEVLDKGVKVGLNGAVENVLVPTGVDVKLSLDSDSISALSKYAGSELPQTDPLKVLATLTEDASKHPNLTVHAETGGVNIDINSVLESLALPEQLELGISVKAKSMSNFNKLAQKELPEKGPVDISTNLKLQIQKKNFAVNDLKLLIKDESASGNLALQLPENDKSPTVINGKLDIAYLDLNFLLPKEEEVPVEGETPPVAATESEPETVEKTEAPKTETASIEPEVNTDRLFPSEPNLGKRLHDYEIDLDVNADKIKFGKADMKDVELMVTLKNGVFSVDPIKGAGGAGNIKGFIHMDGNSETPELKVDLSLLQMPTPNLGGKLDFDVDLTGKGKSVAELMGSLNGQILLVLRDGKIEGALVKKMGSGLLSFSPEKNYTILECGILRVDIKDGIADFEKNLAAQLTEVTWRGGGTVNLKTEKLDAGIVPKPRKGIPISITGSLSGLVHVGGTLKNPKIQLDPKDVAVKYAKYSAHIATGGITLIAEKIKDKIQANQDICAK
ncbi:MAG: AsmA family protein, partial [Pseudomonadota bacterium]|nr:AsmA family protein [Pseudomonadota bacterium]